MNKSYEEHNTTCRSINIRAHSFICKCNRRVAADCIVEPDWLGVKTRSHNKFTFFFRPKFQLTSTLVIDPLFDFDPFTKDIKDPSSVHYLTPPLSPPYYRTEDGSLLQMLYVHAHSNYILILGKASCLPEKWTCTHTHNYDHTIRLCCHWAIIMECSHSTIYKAYYKPNPPSLLSIPQSLSLKRTLCLP